MGSRRRRRGYIETLPSGSYRAVVYAGQDILTKRPHCIRETAATHDAAEVAMTKLLRQVDQQQAPKTSITVGEAIEQWLEVAKLADTTRVRNVDLVRMYINPHLGHVQAGKLDAELLERFYARQAL